MANYSAYAKNYGDLMSDYEKNWKGKISLGEYGKMHYQEYGRKEGRKMPGGSSKSSSGNKTSWEVDGVTYPLGSSRKIFGSNPNKGYKARATLESGTVGGNKVDPGPIGGVNLYMTKRGQRAFVDNQGIKYVELEPGGGRFRSTMGHDEGGEVTISEWTHREKEKPVEESKPKQGGGGSRPRQSSSSGESATDPITSDLDAYIASLDLGSAGSTDYVNAPTAAALAAQNPAEDLGVASGSGISGTVLTSGVTEETSPSVLTPVSATPTTPYAGSTALTAGTQVVDTVNGTVYPNRAAATAAGVKAWMPKTQWDALQASDDG